MIKNIFKKTGLLAPNYDVVMTDNEKRLFVKIIKNSKNYLEFGIGGSTFSALENSKARVYSVESDKAWVKKTIKHPYIKWMKFLGRLKIVYVDIGPTRKWGFPKGNDYKFKYPDYSGKIFEYKNIDAIDTVFVDGRFRVACILSTIFSYYKKSTVKILIHDFKNRPHYHLVLKYLNIINEIDSMVVCVIKKDIDLNSLEDDYNKYKYIPK